MSRGVNGLFKSIMSEPIKLEVTNPCLSSELNPDGELKLPYILSVPLGETEASWNMIGTKDSVSVKYGNGYNLCGPRAYRLRNQMGEPLLNDSLKMRQERVESIEGADAISLNLKSFELGPSMKKKIVVEVYLEEYPDRSISFQTTLEYRECYSMNFKGAQIEK